MAAELTVTNKMTVTGLGSEDQLKNTFTASTVPAECYKVKMVVSTCSLALSPIGVCAISATYGLMIKSISATIYAGFALTSGAVSCCQFAIPEGTSGYFPMNAAACVPITSVYLYCSTNGMAEIMLVAT